MMAVRCDVSDHFKTLEVCDKTVRIDLYSLGSAPHNLKTQGMCNEAVRKEPYALDYVPDQFKTYGMCERAVEENLYTLKFVSVKLITQEMCNKAVEKFLWSLIYVPDHYVRLKEMWCEDYSHVVIPGPGNCNDKLIEWHNGYQK